MTNMLVMQYMQQSKLLIFTRRNTLTTKAYASYGAVGGAPLDPTLFLCPNSQGEFMTMGTIVVTLVGAANIGDLVQYNTTTGVLSTVAPGASATTGNALIPNCVVWNYPQSATGLAAIRITD